MTCLLSQSPTEINGTWHSLMKRINGLIPVFYGCTQTSTATEQSVQNQLHIELSRKGNAFVIFMKKS